MLRVEQPLNTRAEPSRRTSVANAEQRFTVVLLAAVPGFRDSWMILCQLSGYLVYFRGLKIV